MRALFAQVGEVVSVSIPSDRDNGRPRGFAFVEFSTREAAAAAIQKLDGFELGGRALRVNEANERPPRGPSFGPPRESAFGRGGPGPGGPAARPRAKGSRRNVRARKRSIW